MKMTRKQMLEKSEALFEQATEILSNPESTPEEKESAMKMAEDAKRYQTDAVQLAEIEKARADLQEMRGGEEEEEKAVSGPKTVKDFTSWEEYLKSVYYAGHREPLVRRKDDRLVYFDDGKEGKSGHDSKQMVESVGASGGFLVPSEFLPQLQAVAAEDSIVRSRATKIRMQRRQINIPVLDQTGTTAGQPHWFGGMLAYWAEEASEKTLTTAEFRKVSLVAHKLIMYTRASDELLDDSAISLADFLAGPMGFAGAIAWHEDYSFLQGTGAGQPLGVINAGATITVGRAAAGAVGYADLVHMYENFLPSGRGVWVMNQSVLSDMMTIQDPNGAYIWQPNAREGTPNTLFGMPVIFTEKVPRVGTAGDVGLYDFRYYLLGDRQATTVESTQYDYWRYDQTSWRAVHRVDGQPWLSSPLTLQDGTSQISPFVILGNVGSGVT